MQMDRVRTNRIVWTAMLLLCALPAPALGQSMEGTGMVPTGLLLRQLDGVKRVLMIGAHPDDEDTSFLTAIARGWGAETAYLSVTRGDGGQNLIGPELWEGLGVIRTGELEAARSLDGGRQFFTRAFDFGYSKSSEEALRFWERDEVLEDVVWVVRSFRPHVIVSVWRGTPQDGHGHHQASGILAREAFAAAGDPSRYPDQLARGVEAWEPAKLYQTNRRRGGAGAASQDNAGEVLVEIGDYDPLLGRSHLQLAMESRSQHRSQDMGSGQPLGPSRSSTLFVESHVGGEGSELFSGIDTTMAGIVAGLPDGVAGAARPHLDAYLRDVRSARDRFGLDLAGVAESLASALAHLQMADEAAGTAADIEFRVALDTKVDRTTRALMAASGVVVDVRADDDLIVPGQDVTVRMQVWNGGSSPIHGVATQLDLPVGWTANLASADGAGPDGSLGPGTMGVFEYTVAVPADADASRLYFLGAERQGAMFQWPEDSSLWGLPRDPSPVQGWLRYATGSGTDVEVERPWRYVGVDQARGQFTKPVLVVPALSATVSPAGQVWPQADRAPRTLSVTVRSESPESQSGRVRLTTPPGWRATPSVQDFELGAPGSERNVAFSISPEGAAASGNHSFEVSVERADGTVFNESVSVIDYEHIERTVLLTPASAEVTVIPVQVAEGLRVGYIMGTGDDGANAIRALGADVTLLDEAQVRDGAFSDYDVLVLGVRAYEARPDVRAVNDQILDFARDGGTVINQYNQYQFSNGEFAPHSLTIGRPAPRVSDETAAITMLEPDAPVFTTPNRITQDDFEGWVQERGLYFASEWGDAFVPLLELNDPGEDPRHGSLLVSQVGDGVYAYVALSFFRQWSGRVPGAYRLFANLISLSADDWSGFTAGR